MGIEMGVVKEIFRLVVVYTVWIDGDNVGIIVVIAVNVVLKAGDAYSTSLLLSLEL